MRYLVAFLLLLIPLFKTTAQNVCDRDLCVIQFNASFNSANEVQWLGELTDCNTNTFDIVANPSLPKEYKIVVKNPKYIATLGREYKKNRYHWDDAYSFKKILDNFDFIKDSEFEELKEKINKLIGKYEIISIRKNLFSKTIVLLKNYYRNKLNIIKMRNKKY